MTDETKDPGWHAQHVQIEWGSRGTTLVQHLREHHTEVYAAAVQANQVLGDHILEIGQGAPEPTLITKLRLQHEHAVQHVAEVEYPNRPERDGLAGWWRQTADREIQLVVPKAIEYGADDLYEIGRELIACGVRVPEGPAKVEYEAGIDGEKISAYCAELGTWFYLVGKMARWRSAIRAGRHVSDDTLHDIGVYVRMAQRIRAVGAWPGEDRKDT